MRTYTARITLRFLPGEHLELVLAQQTVGRATGMSHWARAVLLQEAGRINDSAAAGTRSDPKGKGLTSRSKKRRILPRRGGAR